MNDQTYQPVCQKCDEAGVITLATEMTHAPWGRIDLCREHYDAAGDADAGREPDYGAVGVHEFCARALAEKRGR